MMLFFASLIPSSLRPEAPTVFERGGSRLPAGLLPGLLVVLLGSVLPLETVQAQTPTATVKNGKGTVRLQTFYDGGLVAPGLYGSGSPADSIPASGPGTRMMWYPAKAAFRAGQVGFLLDGTQWNASKIGQYSAALGVDTKASGFAATAMGQGTTASGDLATAMGRATTASGLRSTALGFSTTASGDYATAMGNQTTASGEAATAMGELTDAGSLGSVAMGSRTTASGLGATAIGIRTTASNQGSVAMGVKTSASGAYATTMGLETFAATDNSLTIGKFNSANQAPDNSLFVVGNGSDANNRSDALVLDNGGNLKISGNLTENSDRRLKTEIQPLSKGVLRKIGELRPVRFEFKNQQTHPSGEQIGLVAQDVQKEFPALVSKGSSGYLSLAYPKLTAVLLKGIQEQQATIDSLKARVQRLEHSTNTRIKKRLAALEAKLDRRTSMLATLMGPWGLTILLAFALGAVGGLRWRRE